MKTCCICGKEFIGYGNNPYPIRSVGECCDLCNIEVIKERKRLANLTMTQEEKLTKLKQLADAMYEATQNMSTDASRLRKAMRDYRQFVISELKGD